MKHMHISSAATLQPSSDVLFELLKLASPEAVVVSNRAGCAFRFVSFAKRAAAACAFVAALGIVIYANSGGPLFATNETLFGGMLVISPLTSLFKIICLALAFFTILLTQAEKAPRHPGEYLALVLLSGNRRADAAGWE